MVDYFFLGLVLLSIGAGFVRGFFKEAISLATWVLATFLALRFGDLFSGFFDNYFGSPVLQIWAGRVAMFVLIVIAGTLTNHLINALLDKSGLSTTDHFLGMIFGLVRGVLLAGLLFASLGGDYSRVGSICSVIYAVGMLVDWLLPKEKSEEELAHV